MYTAKCAIALNKVVISTSYLGNSVGTHPQLVGHRIVAMATFAWGQEIQEMAPYFNNAKTYRLYSRQISSD